MSPPRLVPKPSVPWYQSPHAMCAITLLLTVATGAVLLLHLTGSTNDATSIIREAHASQP